MEHDTWVCSGRSPLNPTSLYFLHRTSRHRPSTGETRRPRISAGGPREACASNTSSWHIFTRRKVSHNHENTQKEKVRFGLKQTFANKCIHEFPQGTKSFETTTVSSQDLAQVEPLALGVDIKRGWPMPICPICPICPFCPMAMFLGGTWYPLLGPPSAGIPWRPRDGVFLAKLQSMETVGMDPRNRPNCIPNEFFWCTSLTNVAIVISSFQSNVGPFSRPSFDFKWLDFFSWGSKPCQPPLE